jgi:hypothetical protein
MSEGVRPGGTYKTLAEQREVLTPAEERFEVVRQTIGLILGPIAFLIMYFLPLPLDRSQHTLAAILTFTIIYWLSEAIPNRSRRCSRWRSASSSTCQTSGRTPTTLRATSSSGHSWTPSSSSLSGLSSSHRP